MAEVTKFDARNTAVGLSRQLGARPLDQHPDPQPPFDGVTFGVADMAENSPHGGERHADGDELLYLISGRVRVVFIDGDGEDIELVPGDGLIVPAGVWHRVDIVEPCRIVYLTPGPNNEYRPLDD